MKEGRILKEGGILKEGEKEGEKEGRVSTDIEGKWRKEGRKDHQCAR